MVEVLGLAADWNFSTIFILSRLGGAIHCCVLIGPFEFERLSDDAILVAISSMWKLNF